MAALIIKYRSLKSGEFPLRRARTTIGRSSKSDLRVPDRFASHNHAVIYREGNNYFLQDLNSTNGTFQNDSKLVGGIPVPLHASDTIRIGECEITFKVSEDSGDDYSTWNDDVAAMSGLDDITETHSGASRLQNFITRVGIRLLGAPTLNDILEQVVLHALELLSADGCLLLVRDEESRFKIGVFRQSSAVNQQRAMAIAETIAERGTAVLVSDIHSDPQFAAEDAEPSGANSLLAVPLQIRGNVFGVLYAESWSTHTRFNTTDLKNLTTLASIAAIRIENEKPTQSEDEQEHHRLEYESYVEGTLSEVQSFLRVAGFEVNAIDGDGFVAEPETLLWQQRIMGSVYTHVHIGKPLNGKNVLEIHDLAQKAGEKMLLNIRHAFVVVDKQVEDSAWLQIAALRSIVFDVIPVPVTLVAGSHSAQSAIPQGLVLATHLERFIGPGMDPYDVRDPVSDVLNFFGREALARNLVNRLISGRAVGLFGLRKIGKSSLMNYMQSLMPCPTAKLDLQAGITPTNIFERLLRLWNTDAQIRFGIDLGLRDVELATSNSASEFVKLSHAALNTLASQGKESRLATFLDEVELITPPTDASREELNLYLSLLRTIRGMVQEIGRFALLVAGVDPSVNRINRWGREQNPFYQLVQEVYLPPLLTSDCIQMIRNIGQQVELTYTDAAGDFIAETSGGHPFLARQLCSLAYSEQGQKPGEMRLKYLHQAADRFLFDPQYAVYLNDRGLWSESTSVELWDANQSQINEGILRTLAASADPVLESVLIAQPDSHTKRSALFSLRQMHIIQTCDEVKQDVGPHFGITFGLFRSWIRRSLLGLES
jgi:hypothetical protein